MKADNLPIFTDEDIDRLLNQHEVKKFIFEDYLTFNNNPIPTFPLYKSPTDNTNYCGLDINILPTHIHILITNPCGDLKRIINNVLFYLEITGYLENSDQAKFYILQTTKSSTLPTPYKILVKEYSHKIIIEKYSLNPIQLVDIPFNLDNYLSNAN